MLPLPPTITATKHALFVSEQWPSKKGSVTTGENTIVAEEDINCRHDDTENTTDDYYGTAGFSSIGVWREVYLVFCPII